ncbi:basic proline-rich protein-like [Acinonyx jubatus]|uniref:Basic proline-rich protein-like n=1 Tax=Acinonyx jubatus TaxID=32536 RepID=A0ABM3NUI8_ACIJB|nr:basic proline-rich protein-like [Acinonyx jubatus]
MQSGGQEADRIESEQECAFVLIGVCRAVHRRMEMNLLRVAPPTPPLPASIKCGRLGDASSPPAHRRAQVGGAPGSPPSPAPPPPHLRRAAPCSAPGRPQRSTGAPPDSSPRAATRSRPARPRLRGAPSPAGPRPARVGGAAWGRGRRGVPAPGADTRRHPASREADQAHAGAAPGDPGSPSPRAPAPRAGRLRTRPRPRVTLYPYPGPGASGSWSLFEHKGPGAKAAALPPPLLRSKPPPQDTLSGFGVQSETPRVGCPSPAPTPATGTLRPRMSRGPRLAPGLPPLPPAVGGGIFGLAEAVPPGGAFGMRAPRTCSGEGRRGAQVTPPSASLRSCATRTPGGVLFPLLWEGLTLLWKENGILLGWRPCRLAQDWGGRSSP